MGPLIPIFQKCFAIIVDGTKIFFCHFLKPGVFEQTLVRVDLKMREKNRLEPIAVIFPAQKESIMKMSPNFNYYQRRYFVRGGKMICYTTWSLTIAEKKYQ